jgi:hypothetical protein
MPPMKMEWRKQEAALYLPKTTPQQIDVPEMGFFTLSGRGNPNSDSFAEAIGVLYALSYAMKMLPKKGITPEGYYDYTVYPLEGVWDLAEEARGQDKLDKDSLLYTLMIRQPDFATPELAQLVLERTATSKPHPLLAEVSFVRQKEGSCAQILHLGSYDDEPASFASLALFCQEHHLRRTTLTHREIYLTDARKTTPEKQKTVLRIQVEKGVSP